MEKPKECFRTRVGGQALIEGIMMRGPEKICVAVRKPDGTIDLMMDQVKHHPWSKIPFLRGVLNMVENLVLGYRYLMHSADVSLEGEEEEEPSKLEQWLQDHLGDAFEKALMGAASVLGVVLALVLFMALPAFCVKTLGRFVPLAGPVKALLEGVVKIAIFVLYLYLCTRMKELHRVFEYHGAEHKTIACYEARLELTVENVRKQIRFHPRCGTSFMILVLLVSIFVNDFLSWDNLALRVAGKLLLLPVVMGVVNPVDYRITHIEIAAGQINFGAKRHTAIGELSRLHPGEQIEVFFDRTIAIRTYCRMGQITAIFPHLIRAELADVCQPFFNQADSQLVHGFKIVRSKVKILAPVKTQPADILLNGIHIFHIFFCWVGVVHTQVAAASVFLRCPKINADRFCVANMQIAVWFRRKTRDNGFAFTPPARSQFFFNDAVDKISGRFGGKRVLFGFSQCCSSSLQKIGTPLIRPKGFCGTQPGNDTILSQQLHNRTKIRRVAPSGDRDTQHRAYVAGMSLIAAGIFLYSFTSEQKPRAGQSSLMAANHCCLSIEGSYTAA